MLTWQQKQMTEAYKRVNLRYGRALNLLSSEMRAALIKAEVLAIIAANDSFSDNPLVKLASIAMQFTSESENSC